MFLLPSLLLGLVFAVLLGGRLSRLLEGRFRLSWAGVLALVAPGGIFSTLGAAAGPLRFLGDVFALPPQLPLANAFSVGDVLIGLGMAAFIVTVSLEGGGGSAPPPRPPRARPPSR